MSLLHVLRRDLRRQLLLAGTLPFACTGDGKMNEHRQLPICALAMEHHDMLGCHLWNWCQKHRPALMPPSASCPGQVHLQANYGSLWLQLSMSLLHVLRRDLRRQLLLAGTLPFACTGDGKMNEHRQLPICALAMEHHDIYIYRYKKINQYDIYIYMYLHSDMFFIFARLL